MTLALNRAIKTAAIIFVFASTQLCIAPGFANRAGGDEPVSSAPGQQVTAVLTTQSKKPIIVNGVSTPSGATILNGATIETPDGVSATIDIPGHGGVEIAANSKITFAVDAAGNIVVKVLQGCATLRTLNGSKGELNDVSGAVTRSDGSKEDTLGQCPGVKTAGAAAGGGGLSPGATVAIIGAGAGTAAALALAGRSRNPSPSGL